MKKIIKNNNNRIVRFLTLGIKIGMVRAYSIQGMNTQRRVSASTLEMKTVVWLAVGGTFRYYSSNINNKIMNNFIPVACYPNVDTLKSVILKENKGKIGIYRWVNIINRKTYVGSSGNLAERFLQYLNINYLERKVKKDNSKIYSSILKNGYSNFRLEILEYCELDILNEREQYYLDTLNPEYNILKFARSFRGFKHSEASLKLMKNKYEAWDKYVSPETRIKQVITQLKGESTIVVKIDSSLLASQPSVVGGCFIPSGDSGTEEKQYFISGREAAKFIGVQQSTISKYIRKNNFYLGRGYLVYKSSTALDEITKSEAYKEAIYKLDNPGKKYTHSESAKELIRKANLGKKLSVEVKQKLSLNSKNAKAVILTNNETKEVLEFTSVLAASKSLGISNSHLDRCLKSNKPCKGYTIVKK